MRGGRGQITAFFLVGLAVLFVFVIILLLRQAILSRNAPNPSVPGQQQYDASRVKGYVESCVDLVANDAFAKLGRQGGLLYASQGGLAPDGAPFSLEVRALDAGGIATQERVRVALGLVNDSGFPFHPPFLGSTATEDEYPFPGIVLSPAAFAAAQRPWSGPSIDGAFGQYSLPPLCDPLGENNGSAAAMRCPTQLFPLPVNSANATQASLESFIAAGVARCIDASALSAQLGADVTMGQPNVTVTFTQRETLVALDLPLRFAAEQGALRLSAFSRRYPVRPVQLSWFAYNLLKRASKDPYFRLGNSTDYHGVAGYDGFVVTQQNLSSASFVPPRRDLLLITIADPSSKVEKATWFFQFLVQARPPVLDRIENAALGADSAPITIPIAALAPDGDELRAVIDSIPVGGGPIARIVVPLSLDPDGRTWRGTVTFGTEEGQPGPGTYNASVTSASSGLSDWQVFTVS